MFFVTRTLGQLFYQNGCRVTRVPPCIFDYVKLADLYYLPLRATVVVLARVSGALQEYACNYSNCRTKYTQV